MTVSVCEEAVLKDALSLIDSSTTARGDLSPQAVVSVIDNICLDLRLPIEQLPDKLRTLRTDAHNRHANGNEHFREDYVADAIVMCGLWAA